MKKFAILFGIIIMLGSAVAYYVFVYTAKHKRNVNNEDAISVSAVELVAAYNTNESQANAKYLNKVLKVEGIVKELGQNQEGVTTVTIDGSNNFSAVFCTLKTKDSSLTVNKKIIIKGVCIGFTSDVVITDSFVQFKD